MLVGWGEVVARLVSTFLACLDGCSLGRLRSSFLAVFAYDLWRFRCGLGRGLNNGEEALPQSVPYDFESAPS
jgi:hypothetical protein